MREIKFRAWNQDDGMSESFGIWDAHLFEEDDEIEVVLMQYTGLKDKNGVEIYEGDILPLGADGYTYDCQVWFNPYRLSFEAKSADGRYTRFGEGIGEGEVIGNIWETPELLEGGDVK